MCLCVTIQTNLPTGVCLIKETLQDFEKKQMHCCMWLDHFMLGKRTSVLNVRDIPGVWFVENNQLELQHFTEEFRFIEISNDIFILVYLVRPSFCLPLLVFPRCVPWCSAISQRHSLSVHMYSRLCSSMMWPQCIITGKFSIISCLFQVSAFRSLIV